MGKEGGLSAVCHFLLAAFTGYHALVDPLGTGTRSMLCFGFSQLCVKSIKLLCKHAAIATGNCGPEAFWRRPSNAPREVWPNNRPWCRTDVRRACTGLYSVIFL